MDFTKAARIIFEKGYAYAGVRTLCDDEQYEAGDRCRESYEWDRDLDCSTYETTGEFANGTCATNIELPPYPDEDDLEEIAESIAKAAKANAGYAGDVQVIIGGHRHNIDSALDYGETRIIDAEVVSVFPKVR